MDDILKDRIRQKILAYPGKANWQIGDCLKVDGRRISAFEVGEVRAAMPKDETMAANKVAGKEASGPAGFRKLHNYGEQRIRHNDQVHALIEKCIDVQLRLKAFLDAGGKEEDTRCPRGWFYDNEGARLAHVKPQDWVQHRDDFKDCQVMVTVDGAKEERVAWVDPDNVAEYREALEA